MASTIWWSTLYLGNLPPMDTDEGTATIESSSQILTTFGSEYDPLATHIIDVKSYSADTNTSITTDNVATSDNVQYDLGSGLVTVKIDAIVVVHGTVEFYDGSTFTSDFGVFQTTNGDTFMLALDSQPTLGSAGIESVTFTSVVNSNYGSVEQTTKDDIDFVCFAPGTRLLTPTGPVRADKLVVGDYLTTVDTGPQPIRWIGKRRYKFEGPHPGQPVEIREGAFGNGLPHRDLQLSGNHRVLVATTPGFELHDPLGALAPAKALTRQRGIRQLQGPRTIAYYTFMLPRHAVIYAEGVAVESLYPGPSSWKTLTGPQRSDWMRLAISGRVTGGSPARLLLTPSEARAGLDAKRIGLPAEPVRPMLWSARNRRETRPLPDHLRAV